MQDKGLDQLFRSKLDGFEAEPGAGIWANISHKLGQPKKRKGGMFWLSIAASVLVLVSAGIFFLPGKPVAVIKPENQLAKNHPGKKPVTTASIVNSSSVINTTQVNVTAQVKHVNNIKTQRQFASARHTAIKQTVTTAQVPDAATTTPAVNNRQPILAAAYTNLSKPVVPDVTTFLNSKPEDVQPVNKPAAVSATVNDMDFTPAPAKNRKIHGLGGLINAVVAVIDKRDDKIIEFTDTNEGNMVTGINLGIVTIKKNK